LGPEREKVKRGFRSFLTEYLHGFIIQKCNYNDYITQNDMGNACYTRERDQTQI
jgi:hypothetical protein